MKFCFSSERQNFYVISLKKYFIFHILGLNYGLLFIFGNKTFFRYFIIKK